MKNEIKREIIVIFGLILFYNILMLGIRLYQVNVPPNCEREGNGWKSNKTTCYFNLAIKNNNATFCNNVPEVKDIYLASHPISRQECLKMSQGISYCKSIELPPRKFYSNELDYRNFCYFKVAEALGDLSICDKMSWYDRHYVYYCYDKVAETRRNPSICNKILFGKGYFDSDKWDNLYSCYLHTHAYFRFIAIIISGLFIKFPPIGG